jgi:hypothetical protein
MTAALHPTPTRIRLLAAVAARTVTGQAREWWLDGLRVTARVREIQDAGWADPGDPPGAVDLGIATAHLRPAGRSVLYAAGRCGSCGDELPAVGGHPDPAAVATACAAQLTAAGLPWAADAAAAGVVRVGTP